MTLKNLIRLASMTGLLLATIASSAIAQESGIPDGFKALRSPDAKVRFNAIALLERFGDASKIALPELRKMTQDPDDAVRLKVAECLWQLQGADPKVLAPIVAQTIEKTESNAIKSFGLAVLEQMGKDSQSAYPVVVKELKNSDFNVQLKAVLVLASWGAEARPALPQLFELLQSDKLGFLEASIATAMGNMGLRAVPSLRDGLESEDLKVRRCCAYALTMLGTKAYKALPALEKLLDAEDPLLRAYACQAIGNTKIYGKKAIPKLEKALKDSSPQVRINAAHALWQINENKSGLPLLLKELQTSKDAFIRSDAANYLGEMPKVASDTHNALAKALADDSSLVKLSVLKALTKLGSDGARHTDKVLPLLKSEEAEIAIAAAIATSRFMNVMPDQAKQVILSGLKDRSPSTQMEALNAILAIEPPLTELELSVRPLTRDENYEVRTTARQCLRKLQMSDRN